MNTNDFTNNELPKPFHSSQYAEAASGGSMGSTSAQSFQQRIQIDRSRKSVRKYRDSHIGRATPLRTGDAIVVSRVPEIQKDASPAAQRQEKNATAQPIVAKPAQNFKEPPHRGFNPFK